MFQENWACPYLLKTLVSLSAMSIHYSNLCLKPRGNFRHLVQFLTREYLSGDMKVVVKSIELSGGGSEHKEHMLKSPSAAADHMLQVLQHETSLAILSSLCCFWSSLGVIFNPLHSHCYWAQLAWLQFVAPVPEIQRIPMKVCTNPDGNFDVDGPFVCYILQIPHETQN